jgi:hypothetical protein
MEQLEHFFTEVFGKPTDDEEKQEEEETETVGATSLNLGQPKPDLDDEEEEEEIEDSRHSSSEEEDEEEEDEGRASTDEDDEDYTARVIRAVRIEHSRACRRADRAFLFNDNPLRYLSEQRQKDFMNRYGRNVTDPRRFLTHAKVTANIIPFSTDVWKIIDNIAHEDRHFDHVGLDDNRKEAIEDGAFLKKNDDQVSAIDALPVPDDVLSERRLKIFSMLPDGVREVADLHVRYLSMYQEFDEQMMRTLDDTLTDLCRWTESLNPSIDQLLHTFILDEQCGKMGELTTVCDFIPISGGLVCHMRDHNDRGLFLSFEDIWIINALIRNGSCNFREAFRVTIDGHATESICQRAHDNLMIANNGDLGPRDIVRTPLWALYVCSRPIGYYRAVVEKCSNQGEVVWPRNVSTYIILQTLVESKELVPQAIFQMAYKAIRRSSLDHFRMDGTESEALLKFIEPLLCKTIMHSITLRAERFDGKPWARIEELKLSVTVTWRLRCFRSQPDDLILRDEPRSSIETFARRPLFPMNVETSLSKSQSLATAAPTTKSNLFTKTVLPVFEYVRGEKRE